MFALMGRLLVASACWLAWVLACCFFYLAGRWDGWMLGGERRMAKSFYSAQWCFFPRLMHFVCTVLLSVSGGVC